MIKKMSVNQYKKWQKKLFSFLLLVIITTTAINAQSTITFTPVVTQISNDFKSKKGINRINEAKQLADLIVAFQNEFCREGFSPTMQFTSQAEISQLLGVADNTPKPNVWVYYLDVNQYNAKLTIEFRSNNSVHSYLLIDNN